MTFDVTIRSQVPFENSIMFTHTKFFNPVRELTRLLLLMLMKVLSISISKVMVFLVPNCRQLDVFQFLEDVSPLTQKTSSVLTNRRGAGRLNSVWGCP